MPILISNKISLFDIIKKSFYTRPSYPRLKNLQKQEKSGVTGLLWLFSFVYYITVSDELIENCYAWEISPAAKVAVDVAKHLSCYFNDLRDKCLGYDNRNETTWVKTWSVCPNQIFARIWFRNRYYSLDQYTCRMHK